MNYFLTNHARQRMEERMIPEKIVEESLQNPTNIFHDQNGRILIKKLYRRKKRYRLLLIVGEPINGAMRIITIIDTLKFKKYL